MNTIDILQSGHKTVVKAVHRLPEADWHTAGVCGTWSVKDIIAHLASYEQLLKDVLRSLIEAAPTPALDSFRTGIDYFNDIQVERRRKFSVTDVWTDYASSYQQTIDLITQIPIGRRRINGLLPWYGLEYDLEDFIIYDIYGHKREHSSQIVVFRNQSAIAAVLKNSSQTNLSGQVHSGGNTQ